MTTCQPPRVLTDWPQEPYNKHIYTSYDLLLFFSPKGRHQTSGSKHVLATEQGLARVHQTELHMRYVRLQIATSSSAMQALTFYIHALS